MEFMFSPFQPEFKPYLPICKAKSVVVRSDIAKLSQHTTSTWVKSVFFGSGNHFKNSETAVETPRKPKNKPVFAQDAGFLCVGNKCNASKNAESVVVCADFAYKIGKYEYRQ